jgi:hypothetical protein
VKFGVIVDVEASRSIRQAEVGAAKTMIERTEERFGLKPERLVGDTAYGAAPMLNWLVGELRLRQDPANAQKAETCFRCAVETAREQQAKSWELRASTSLARLGRDQGKRTDARDLLAPVYGWFTEGFDTLDLKEAKALIDELHD